ncbi:peptidase T [Xylocopilactobacillus apicola]|uniref:Peptidase T n=1 Tax=Xylocopilactobacillus apicola TaxID=2932184 RepID=A0AAU9CX96_9LACO|nr:peptidase T [Xylocopilactobacillus apicola]BDR58619.1 peptidase T [Xylocopilactobacillus apicola]
MKYQKLKDRFLNYVKINTRSDESSKTIPSTASQRDFLLDLADELKEIGLSEVSYNPKNSYLTATLNSNIEQKVPVVGLISHVDTADFNSENINPQIIENYDGKSPIPLANSGFVLDPKDSPNLKNYAGDTLITTDGTTLLGADDKAGVSEIVCAMEYLIDHPEISHGKVRIAFGPDEEIGVGADKFDVAEFGADFAYTVDGGPLGELEWETFNAASLAIKVQGYNIHPSIAYGKMINALQVAIDFHNSLPQDEFPENTKDREGFFHLTSLEGAVDEAKMSYIIRDFERSGLEERKNLVTKIVKRLNQKYGENCVQAQMHDQYYNMAEVMKDHMEVVELAEKAMTDLGITPIISPVRGGTDGSKISLMGLPTPNLFAGGENMHGRYEYVSLQTMEQATDVLLQIIKLNAEKEDQKCP